MFEQYILPKISRGELIDFLTCEKICRAIKL